MRRVYSSIVSICFRGMLPGGDNAGGISGVYASILDMLHHRRNEYIIPVAKSVCFGLDGVFQVSVDEYGTVGRYTDGGGDVHSQFFLVMHYLHTASPEHIRRPHDKRVADAFGYHQGFF